MRGSQLGWHGPDPGLAIPRHAASLSGPTGLSDEFNKSVVTPWAPALRVRFETGS
jgi:hypothetical protein